MTRLDNLAKQLNSDEVSVKNFVCWVMFMLGLVFFVWAVGYAVVVLASLIWSANPWLLIGGIVVAVGWWATNE